MAHVTLNCPTCRKRLVYVPLDGLTLHFHCDEHGLLIFKPLVQLASDDHAGALSDATASQRRASDAA